MAASLEGVLSQNLREKLSSCKVLVVGAGGIGCELLKNLVLTGFEYIEVVNIWIGLSGVANTRFSSTIDRFPNVFIKNMHIHEL